MSIVRDTAGDRQTRGLSRDEALDALREYARRYGPAFTQAAFNPSLMRWNDREDDYADRYAEGREDGSAWPSLNAMKKATGMSWNELRSAADLPLNRPGGRGRRRSFEHRPRLDDPSVRVLTRRVTVKDTAARRELDGAKTEIERLRGQLDALRSEVKNLRRRKPTVKPVVDPEVRRRLRSAEERLERSLRREVSLRDERDAERARAAVAERQVRALELMGDDEDWKAVAAEARASMQEAQDRAERYRVDLQRLRDRPAPRPERVEVVREVEVIERVPVVRDELLVAAARRDVELAEARATEAERLMAEQARAVIGEQRPLSADEVAELRAKGPSGPAVMGDALRLLAKARSSPGDGRLTAALTAVASAAVTWRDRL